MNKIKISVVIPCFNMELFIRKTLDSLISQEYVNLELIVVDGGSTDLTLDILNEYRSRIDILISEKDEGQYDAIQKGIDLATGDILCWLNADDVYFPWTLEIVAKIFSENHEVKWIAGIPAFLDENGVVSNMYNTISARPAKLIKFGAFRKNVFGYLQQESMFWRREVWQKTDGLDLNLKLAADFELWTRFANYYPLVSVGVPLAGFRKHSNSRSKLLMESYEEEVRSVIGSGGKVLKLIERISAKSSIANKMIRLLFWQRCTVVFPSVSKNSWIKKRTWRPISTLSFSQLLLEKS